MSGQVAIAVLPLGNRFRASTAVPASLDFGSTITPLAGFDYLMTEPTVVTASFGGHKSALTTFTYRLTNHGINSPFHIIAQKMARLMPASGHRQFATFKSKTRISKTHAVVKQNNGPSQMFSFHTQIDYTCLTITCPPWRRVPKAPFAFHRSTQLQQNPCRKRSTFNGKELPSNIIDFPVPTGMARTCASSIKWHQINVVPIRK